METPNLIERALTFDCCGERLVGVLAEPMMAATCGIVVIVGGPQYRVGSHRQFVLFARNLAGLGVPTLRFDYRGMGDSTGARRGFEDAIPDIGAAVDAMQSACPAIEQVVLWGLCDAASNALMYCQATRDTRIGGLVLLNPWVRSDASLAKTHIRHYYRSRIVQKEFWVKLVRGGVDLGGALKSIAAGIKIVGLERSAGAPPATHSFQDRMADGLRGFSGPVLVLLSERDLTAREFLDHVRDSAQWSGLLERDNVERRDITGADHTFSTSRWRAEVERCTLDWLLRSFEPHGR